MKSGAYPVIAVIGIIIFLSISINFLRREQPKLGHEVNYFPNRTVIRVKTLRSAREVLVEIEKKYNIEEVIDRGFPHDPFRNLVIIARPKEPNSPLP